MFLFSFGGPKVREADATVGGVRAVKIGDDLEASRKIFPYGYFTDVKPIPAYVGVTEPMKVYSHGLHPVHQLQDEERGGREDHRHHGATTSPTWWRWRRR